MGAAGRAGGRDHAGNTGHHRLAVEQIDVVGIIGRHAIAGRCPFDDVKTVEAPGIAEPALVEAAELGLARGIVVERDLRLDAVEGGNVDGDGIAEIAVAGGLGQIHLRRADRFGIAAVGRRGCCRSNLRNRLLGCGLCVRGLGRLGVGSLGAIPGAGAVGGLGRLGADLRRRVRAAGP
jgi:hypothetical protein